MEKTKRAAVVAPVDVGWKDIGSWSEVTSQADGETILQVGDASNNIIRTDDKFVSAIGVSDLIIVATDDSVLVARKDDAQAVREVAEYLKKSGRDDLL